MKNGFSEYKYLIDMHCHTKPGSGCSEIPPKMLVDVYKENGVDAVCITNHLSPEYFENGKEKAFTKFISDFKEAYEYGKKEGVTVILGLEIRFKENANDYLVFGIDEEFVEKACDYIDKDIETFYKEMKNDKNVILQAHPFRNGMVLANPKYIDGIEAFNMHPNHNSRVSLASKYAKEHSDFIVTAGTDFHHLGHECAGLTALKTLPKDSFELADLLKTKDYIFILGGTVAIPYGK